MNEVRRKRMMHRAVRARFIPAALLWLGVTVPAFQARAEGLPADDPGVGRRIAAEVAKSSADANGQRLNSILKEAADAYERAAFGIAVDWYDNARALAPDRAEIQELLKLAVDKQLQQREAQKNLPDDSAKRDEYFGSLYDQARKSAEAGDLHQAHESLRSLWLLAGNYKDTVKLMSDLRGKMESAKAPEVKAEAQPAPAADQAPAKSAKNEIDGLVVRAQM